MPLTTINRLVELETESADAELSVVSNKRDLQDHMRVLWSHMNAPEDVLYAGEFDRESW